MARPLPAGLRVLLPLAGLSLLGGCAMQAPLEPRVHPEPSSPGPAAAGLLVVDLVDGTGLDEARALTGLALAWAHPRSADEALATVEVEDLAAAMDRLEGLPGVEAAEPSIAYEATGLLPSWSYPDDPLWDRQWNMQIVGAPAGWRVGGGRGVTVAVIDTGVSPVRDLEGTTLLEGVSFVPGRDSAVDDNGHGSHVAGTIAQTTHNGLGVAGLAPHARVLPLKALSGLGMGQSEWIASAIDEAVDQGADVINLSLGGPRSEVIELAVEKAAAAGVIVVAAAGNSGREGVGWPARSPSAIGVSATGPGDLLAPYSTWGEGVDLAAPGGDKRSPGGGILQDTIDGGKEGHAFKELQGTSMASPHVAGAAAVLLGAGAGSPQAVRQALLDSAVDLGEPGPDPRFGHGRLDLAAAVRHLLLVERGSAAALGMAIGLVLAGMGGMRRRALVAVGAGVVAGGLFFLPLLPLPPSPWVDALARPLLSWPQLLLSPRLAANPIWLSALAPALLTFFLGPTRSLGWAAAAVCAGVAGQLLTGALTGHLLVSWLPAGWSAPWLIGNALLCGLLVLAIAGVEKVQRQKA